MSRTAARKAVKDELAEQAGAGRPEGRRAEMQRGPWRQRAVPNLVRARERPGVHRQKRGCPTIDPPRRAPSGSHGSRFDHRVDDVLGIATGTLTNSIDVKPNGDGIPRK